MNILRFGSDNAFPFAAGESVQIGSEVHPVGMGHSFLGGWGVGGKAAVM